jgi:energy-coupling factor transporter ATP-binding protein EcfA2
VSPHQPAVVFEDVTVTYAGSSQPALRQVSLVVQEAELALVVGPTGAGKSTLLAAINGTVPHFSGGTLHGRVLVAGQDTRTHRPRDLADVVGVVGQDPLAGFVTDTVEEELAYGMEQLGLAPEVMRKRVEETLDLLGIADLRDAPLRDLSGGQQQRVAIGSVLTAHPSVLVLDEPTSALDPTGAEEVLAAITRLVHDLSVTVVLAEHRLERVLQYADQVLHVAPGGTVTSGSPAAVMESSMVAPPVVELGRWAKWAPLPLSVRDARRVGGALRQELAALDVRERPDPPQPDAFVCIPTSLGPPAIGNEDGPGLPHSPPVLAASRVVVRYGATLAVAGVDLTLAGGEVVALMGRNGSGKSSLLWALQGSGPRTSGDVRTTVRGTRADPARLAAAERRQAVGLVPQTASDLLYLDTVDAECQQADRDGSAAPGTCATLLRRLAPGIPADRHPRDLSEGQRLALVLAVQLTADPPSLLLDEPTRGLDYAAKRSLSQTLREQARRGRTVLLATHDVEFVAETADRVVILAGGERVADGPTAAIVTASPAFAPQTAKITAPGPWLTVEQVKAALGSPP